MLSIDSLHPFKNNSTSTHPCIVCLFFERCSDPSQKEQKEAVMISSLFVLLYKYLVTY